jgi:NAD+ diphosphatase
MHSFQFCPKCGEKSLEGNRRRIACSSCGFVFYFNAASAVAGIIQKDDTILLTIRGKEPKKGKLDLPGGFVDQEETAEAALQREIQEELNLDITDIQFFGSFPNQYLYKEFTYPVLDFIFTCRAKHWENIKPLDDVADFAFYKKEEIHVDDFAFPSTRKAMKKFLRQ